MKKLLGVLLAAALLCGILTVGVSAAEADYTGKTVILYTGNLRGDVDAYPRIAAAKAAYAAKGAEVYLMDAGNYLQGSAAANTDMGLSIYNLMDAAGYDVAAMGLAEFSYADATTGYPYHGNFTRYYTQKMLQDGTEAIEYSQDRAGEVKATLPAKEPAKFKTVSVNVFADKDTYAYEDFALLETRSGLILSVYGLTDPTVAGLVQDGFISGAALMASRAVEADLNICLTNAPGVGGETYGNVVICAPTGGEAIVGAYVIDNATREITHEEVDLSGVHEAVAELAIETKENAAPAAAKLDVILNGADSANRNSETNLGDLVTDALALYARDVIDGWDKSLPLVAIQNGGNIDQFLYTGDVTEVDLLRALPFSPMGVGVLEVTGAQLLETLEAASQCDDCPGFAQVHGLKYIVDRSEDYDGGAAYGKYYVADSVNRVTITEVNGETFDPGATYALVADNYILNGNDTYYTLKNAKDAGSKYINNGAGVLTRDIVAMYLAAQDSGKIAKLYVQPQERIAVREGSRFSDVKRGDYYYDAVDWAVDSGITKGTGDAVFSPDAPCTRAQLVTFLYRAAGSPEINGDNPFADVAANSDYYNAILWAAANGVTAGVDETHFAPDRTVTRAEAVTFLFRYAGETVWSGTDNPFEDVPAGAFYEPPVLWAAAKGVTTGVDAAHFDPSGNCTRGQIVTFLYRYANL